MRGKPPPAGGGTTRGLNLSESAPRLYLYVKPFEKIIKGTVIYFLKLDQHAYFYV